MVSGNDRIKMSTSIIDYIFRELAVTYLGRSELAQVSEEDLRADSVSEPEDPEYTEEVVVEERVAANGGSVVYALTVLAHAIYLARISPVTVCLRLGLAALGGLVGAVVHRRHEGVEAAVVVAVHPVGHELVGPLAKTSRIVKNLFDFVDVVVLARQNNIGDHPAARVPVALGGGGLAQHE